MARDLGPARHVTRYLRLSGDYGDGDHGDGGGAAADDLRANGWVFLRHVPHVIERADEGFAEIDVVTWLGPPASNGGADRPRIITIRQNAPDVAVGDLNEDDLIGRRHSRVGRPV